MKKVFLTGLLLVSVILPHSVVAKSVRDYDDLTKARLSSVECIASNLYHEARSESDLANIQIINVVLNRVKSKRYPNTICGVVFQKSQFSWTSDGLSDKIHNERQYNRLHALTEKVLIHKDLFLSLSENVTHYHSVKINPYWVNDRDMVYVGRIDNHKFYEWR